MEEVCQFCCKTTLEPPPAAQWKAHAIHHIFYREPAFAQRTRHTAWCVLTSMKIHHEAENHFAKFEFYANIYHSGVAPPCAFCKAKENGFHYFEGKSLCISCLAKMGSWSVTKEKLGE